MFDRHISRQLAAYIDRQLPLRELRQVELHLSQCALCQAESEQVRLGVTMVDHLPTVEAPEAIWKSLEAALPRVPSRKSSRVLYWRMAFAATVALALAATAYWRIANQSGTRWEVATLSGSPAVAAKHIGGTGRVGAGEWIETDGISRASVQIGTIGTVEVASNTRVRVVTARPGEHRLSLAQGEIHARISAPPRLFFVETPSGTAVDLGCEYSLRTAADGAVLLQVTKGWVAFEWQGIESLVPAGASCRTRPQLGPGIPYFDDASGTLQQALDRLGIEKSAESALITILAESRVRDTLSLWHLLSRVAPGDRERIYNRIAALTPVPAGVSREQVLKLDPQTLKLWREELAWTW